MKPAVLLTLLLLILVPGSLAEDAGDAESQAPDTAGLQLIEALGCRACHRIQGYGGSIAADLSTVGSRMTIAEIRTQLATHSPTRTGHFMPAYASLTPEELDLLSAYLYHLP